MKRVEDRAAIELRAMMQAELNREHKPVQQNSYLVSRNASKLNSTLKSHAVQHSYFKTKKSDRQRSHSPTCDSVPHQMHEPKDSPKH